MEEAGRIRRGYFVDGLGAAQFALPGAVDRLRALRDQPGELAGEHGRVVHLLAAADPANPYGSALPWPRRSEADRRPFQRAAGAYVVLVDGAAALYVDRGGTSLQALPAADDPETLAVAMRALGDLVADGRVRELVISKVDGEPVATSPYRDALLAAGFVAGYRGYALRPRTRARADLPAADAGPPDALTRCPRATRSTGRPPACGRISSGRSSRPRPPGSRGRRRRGWSARRSRRSRRRARTCCSGSTTASRSGRTSGCTGRGTATAPASAGGGPRPARASCIEVPGSIAVCFDAPTVELFEQRTEALHGALARLGPDLLRDPFDSTRRPAPPRPGTRRGDDRRGTARPARARRHRQRLQERGPVHRARRRRSQPVQALDDATLVRLVETATAAPAHERRRAVRRRRARHDRGSSLRRRAALGLSPLRSPVPPLRHAIRSDTCRATDLPRLTFWCPRCQSDPAGTSTGVA